MDIRELNQQRLVKSIQANEPGPATVVTRLAQVITEIKTGAEHANKVVIILLDDSDNVSYYFTPYSAGLKPSEAAFLCNMGYDAFKGLILPR